MVKNKHLPQSLSAVLASIPRMALAFSGGVDSRFLAAAAKLSGCEARLCHAAGPHVAEADTSFVKKWASQNNFALDIIPYNPMALPEVAVNGPERCYACKKSLFERIRARVSELPGQWLICDGSQADDSRSHRPGRRAILEAGIVSPLAEAGLGKAQIRSFAQNIGLSLPEQKARPCLLTRLAYGLRPNADLLQRISICEERLQSILPAAVDFRLRITPRPVLQSSAPLGELSVKALKILSEEGFNNCEILVSGQISGFFDRPAPASV